MRSPLRPRTPDRSGTRCRSPSGRWRSTPQASPGARGPCRPSARPSRPGGLLAPRRPDGLAPEDVIRALAEALAEPGLDGVGVARTRLLPAALHADLEL